MNSLDKLKLELYRRLLISKQSFGVLGTHNNILFEALKEDDSMKIYLENIK